MDNLLEYNLFANLFDSSKPWEQQMILFADTAVNIFILLSVLYMIFKVTSAVYMYQTQAVHAIQKNQMYREILEPIWGLFYLTAGLVLVKILILVILNVAI